MAKSKTQEATGDAVSSLKELAKICGVSEYKMKGYRQLVGFPVREDRKYSPEDVLAFLANGATPNDDPPPEESGEKSVAGKAYEEWNGIRDRQEGSPQTVQPLAVSPEPVEWITIRVPVAPPSGYIAAQTSFDAPAVQTRLRDPGQIRGLQHLHAGCRDAHVQLPNGEHVDTRAEVFRWLFGEIDKAVTQSVPA